MSLKKQLLDPLGTLCKLAALNFNELHTRISIRDHVLNIQPPSSLQGIIRTLYGDKREDISELYYAIVRVIKWYLIPNYKSGTTNVKDDNNDGMVPFGIDIDESVNDDDNIEEQNINNNSEHVAKSKELRSMVGYVCEALKKYQLTYKFGNSVLALQFYINLLQSGLNGYYNDNMLPDCILKMEREYENLLDYDKLKNLWTVKQIKMIYELFTKCYNLLDDKTLPEKTRDALIEGHMRSIYAILEITDTEFQKLIQNSNKG